MRIFITSNLSKLDDKAEIEKLHGIIKSTGHEFFNFVLSYPKFNDPHQTMSLAKKELLRCDAILIDASDSAVCRLIEVGIAYCVGKKIIVIAKVGTKREKMLEGVADLYVEYNQLDEIRQPLTDYLDKING